MTLVWFVCVHAWFLKDLWIFITMPNDFHCIVKNHITWSQIPWNSISTDMLKFLWEEFVHGLDWNNFPFFPIEIQICRGNHWALFTFVTCRRYMPNVYFYKSISPNWKCLPLCQLQSLGDRFIWHLMNIGFYDPIYIIYFSITNHAKGKYLLNWRRVYKTIVYIKWPVTFYKSFRMDVLEICSLLVHISQSGKLNWTHTQRANQVWRRKLQVIKSLPE